MVLIIWQGHYSYSRGSPCPCTLGTARVPTSQAAVAPSCSAFTGAELPQAKKVLYLCTQGHFSCVWTLWSPVDCGLPGFPVREGGSPSKNTGAYWPVLVAITFKSTIFSAALAANPLSTWCCQNPCDPSSCTTSTPGPHRGKPKPSRATSGANPAEQPTHRGEKKITIETQGQCGWERRPKTFPPAIKAGRLNPHDQRGRLCVYGIYKSSLRAPTKENTLVLIAVDIGGKNAQE